MKKHNDNELSNLFKSVQNIEASSQEISNWKRSVGEFRVRSKSSKFLWLQLTGALCLGVIVGILVHKQFSSEPNTSQVLQEISQVDATFEHTHINLD